MKTFFATWADLLMLFMFSKFSQTISARTKAQLVGAFTQRNYFSTDIDLEEKKLQVYGEMADRQLYEII